MAIEPLDRLGLEASVEPGTHDAVRLTVRSRRLAYGMWVHVGDHVPNDDAFSVEPGGTWAVDLRHRDARRGFTVGAATGHVRAVPKPRVPRSDRRGAA